jgi:hypothetical protein
MAYINSNQTNFIESYLDCPEPTASGPVNSECQTSKNLTWSNPGNLSQYFFVQNVNKNIVGFTFSGITNNGSSINVDLVYQQNGIQITATTFNLGVITSNTTKYHYLDFGNTVNTNGLLFLKFRIVGGTSGSIDIFLNCSATVGSREFCYQLVNTAARDLCTKCANRQTFYFPKPLTSSVLLPQNALFNFGNLYIDPELTTLAPSGYYVPYDSQSPKVIWAFTGGTPSIAYKCDDNLFACESSLSQVHQVSTDYKFNSPYLPGVTNITISGLKYSTKEYFLDLGNTDYGYFTITVSNNQNYLKNKINASILYLSP